MTGPQPSHAWTSLLIADINQDGLGEQITEAVVLSHWGGNLIFQTMITERWAALLVMQGMLDSALASPVNWAGREAQMEINGEHCTGRSCQVIAWMLSVNKRTKARGPGCTSKEQQRQTWTPAAAYSMEEWMQGLEEDASESGSEK